MKYQKVIKGLNVELKAIDESYCQSYYLTWLEDKQVNRYLETRWQKQSLEKIKEFVQMITESSHSYLFAIIYKNKHVGNIKIGPIHPIYKYADISYFVGDKSCWGNGVATEAVGLILKFGFEKLNLNRIEAGTFEQNAASQRVLLKNNFKREAIYYKRTFLEPKSPYNNNYMFAILKDDFVGNKST